MTHHGEILGRQPRILGFDIYLATHGFRP
jgi:hypothetical protein